MIGEGPSARSVRIDLPRFTLIGATTRQGLLTTPLRDRFGIPVRLNFYTVEELEQVVRRAARLLGVDSPRKARMRSPAARAARRASPAGCSAGCAISPMPPGTDTIDAAVADRALVAARDRRARPRRDGPALSDHDRRPLRRRPGRRRDARRRPQRAARHDRGRDRALPHSARPHRPHRTRPLPQRPRLHPSRPEPARRRPDRPVRFRSSRSAKIDLRFRTHDCASLAGRLRCAGCPPLSPTAAPAAARLCEGTRAGCACPAGPTSARPRWRPPRSIPTAMARPGKAPSPRTRRSTASTSIRRCRATRA